MIRLFVCLIALVAPAAAVERPNIIYILADDLGYGDLGCYGQETLKTPNLDRLAAEGMRFTRHYSGSTVCAPSRCVLMTGRHTGRCSVRGNGPALMPDSEVTVAEVLKGEGYATGCFGKWGIGNPPPIDDPNRQGFDEFFGYVNMFHAHNFYPEFLVKNGEKVKLRNVVKEAYAKFRGDPAKDGVGVAEEKLDYAPHLIAEAALEFIEVKKAEPFFLYLALNIPHANNEGGRDPDPARGMEVPDWGQFEKKDWPPAEKGFAAMIEDIDNTVGKVLKRLTELGIDGRTLVIFSSDNGPHQEGRHQMEFFDSNGDLRGMKRDLYEGGVRVPMIARWPGKIAAGSDSDHLSGFQDLLPTLAELAGAKPPERIDGISMVPTLLGVGRQRQHPYLYWEFLEKGGRVAVTDGRWKAVWLNTLKEKPEPVELFDLAADPAEAKDVAAEQPRVVARMTEWRDEAHTPPRGR